jgi:uncharacterized membrane protein
MRSRVRALRRPVHPMLVMFLVALFITGSIFDVIHLFTDNATFAEVGFWCIGVGLVGAVLTGLADWSKISHGTRARSAALVVVELAAVGVAGVAAWLGGELVGRLGIGVDEDANPDAPSSLTGLVSRL